MGPPPRDWGQRVSPRLWPGFSSDVGLFLGGGIKIEKYSFRKYPFSSQYLVRAGYATGTRNFRFNLEGEFRGLNSRVYPSFSLDASGLEILRFYGYGNVELRLKLGRALIIIPGEWGIFGLMDIGRVYLSGESSTRWHRAAGGGLFFSVLDLSTVFSLAVAQSEERISVYFRLGYSF